MCGKVIWEFKGGNVARTGLHTTRGRPDANFLNAGFCGNLTESEYRFWCQWVAGTQYIG